MNYDTVGIERLHVQLVDSQLFWWMSIHHSFNEFIKSRTDFFSTYTGSQGKRVIFQKENENCRLQELILGTYLFKRIYASSLESMGKTFHG